MTEMVPLDVIGPPVRPDPVFTVVIIPDAFAISTDPFADSVICGPTALALFSNKSEFAND